MTADLSKPLTVQQEAAMALYGCEASDLVTGRALVEALCFPELLIDESEDDPSEPGGTSVMGYRGMLDFDIRRMTGEIPTHVRVRSTENGEGSNDLAYRSNVLALLRDFPETFVHVTGGRDAEYLALPLDCYIPSHLVDCLVSLAEDYIVYDEMHYSELESETQDEDWENYGRQDTVRDIERAVQNRIDDQESELYADDLVEEYFDYCNESIDDAWHAFCQNGDGEEVSSESDGTIFRTYDFVVLISDRIIAANF